MFRKTMQSNYRHQYLSSGSSDASSSPQQTLINSEKQQQATRFQNHNNQHQALSNANNINNNNNNNNGLPNNYTQNNVTISHQQRHLIHPHAHQHQHQLQHQNIPNIQNLNVPYLEHLPSLQRQPQQQRNVSDCCAATKQLHQQFRQINLNNTHLIQNHNLHPSNNHHHHHPHHNQHHQMIHAKSTDASQALSINSTRQKQLTAGRQQCEDSCQLAKGKAPSITVNREVGEGRELEGKEEDEEGEEEEEEEDFYARQLRSSQIQYRFQQSVQSHPMQQRNQHNSASGSSASSSPHSFEVPISSNSSAGGGGLTSSSRPLQSNQPRRSSLTAEHNKTTASQQASSVGSVPTSSHLHVNFNRSNQLGFDEEDSDGRKKKYLTAKYGAQQMNLIKKRLKVETWLYEQLKDLAKGSNCEDELDEIDIDLDRLLDMEDDDTRRSWLKKTLEPFDDLPKDKLGKFIEEVLEQSKLL